MWFPSWLSSCLPALQALPESDHTPFLSISSLPVITGASLNKSSGCCCWGWSSHAILNFFASETNRPVLKILSPRTSTSIVGHFMYTRLALSLLNASRDDSTAYPPYLSQLILRKDSTVFRMFGHRDWTVWQPSGGCLSPNEIRTNSVRLWQRHEIVVAVEGNENIKTCNKATRKPSLNKVLLQVHTDVRRLESFGISAIFAWAMVLLFSLPAKTEKRVS